MPEHIRAKEERPRPEASALPRTFRPRSQGMPYPVLWCRKTIYFSIVAPPGLPGVLKAAQRLLRRFAPRNDSGRLFVEDVVRKSEMIC